MSVQVAFGAVSCRTLANRRNAFLLLSHARRLQNTAVKPSSRSSTSCMLACWLQNRQVPIHFLKVLYLLKEDNLMVPYADLKSRQYWLDVLLS